MNNYLLVLATFLSMSMAQAVEVQCPAKVHLAIIATSPPTGWLAYKSKGSSVPRKGETPGAFRRVTAHDGSPFEVLGDLIPDNDESGQKQGLWLWTVKGLPVVYAGCEYVGTNILLVKKLEGTNISSCRVTVSGNIRRVLSCH